MIGTIGCTPGRMSKPAAVIASRKYAVFSASRSRSSVVWSSRSNTAKPAAARAGGSELLNRYGRDRCRSSSTIGARAAVNPPEAPPSALPRVLVMTSISPCCTPQCSGVPRPVEPMNPVACESSTITSASCSRASSTMRSSGAMSPSMENTPSVAISRSRAPAASLSLAFRSSISACA